MTTTVANAFRLAIIALAIFDVIVIALDAFDHAPSGQVRGRLLGNGFVLVGLIVGSWQHFGDPFVWGLPFVAVGLGLWARWLPSDVLLHRLTRWLRRKR